jgi:hypothetical protein
MVMVGRGALAAEITIVKFVTDRDPLMEVLSLTVVDWQLAEVSMEQLEEDDGVVGSGVVGVVEEGDVEGKTIIGLISIIQA